MLFQHMKIPALNSHFKEAIIEKIGSNEYFNKWDEWCALHGIKPEITEADMVEAFGKHESPQEISELVTPVLDMLAHTEKHNLTQPRKFTMFVSIAYLHMLGYRWRQYNTLDGLVMALECKKPVTQFPVVINSGINFLKDFHRLSGQSFATMLSKKTFREIGINNGEFYFSLKKHQLKK